MVVEASSKKAPIAKIADKISGYFVPIVMCIAFLALIFWLIITKDFSFAINIFITVLVVACPCSLGLATPLAIVVASGEASREGILIKNNEVLENAHKVKTIVFDKTGTLTKGKLGISKMYNYSKISDENILKIIASIEAKSEHPIAIGIVKEAKEKNINLEKISEFKNLAGLGVSAIYKENKYYIGNSKLLKENNIKPKEDDENVLQEEGNSILYLANEKEVMALIGVKDTLKENAKQVIEKLKKNKKQIVMLTGDNKKTANKIAKYLGIDNVKAEVMPKDKSLEIEKIKKDGLVMMCGDGINDSVSLVKADIGVSVGSGTDIAMDSSDVVLMNDNLNKINNLIEISRLTVRKIKQNLFWAFFYNICMIPIAIGILEPLGIVMNPMLASIAMTISSISVTLNSLILKKQIKKQL